jgi:hypothetical protein
MRLTIAEKAASGHKTESAAVVCSRAYGIVIAEEDGNGRCVDGEKSLTFEGQRQRWPFAFRLHPLHPFTTFVNSGVTEKAISNQRLPEPVTPVTPVTYLFSILENFSENEKRYVTDVTDVTEGASQ